MEIKKKGKINYSPTLIGYQELMSVTQYGGNEKE